MSGSLAEKHNQKAIEILDYFPQKESGKAAARFHDIAMHHSNPLDARLCHENIAFLLLKDQEINIEESGAKILSIVHKANTGLENEKIAIKTENGSAVKYIFFALHGFPGSLEAIHEFAKQLERTKDKEDYQKLGHFAADLPDVEEILIQHIDEEDEERIEGDIKAAQVPTPTKEKLPKKVKSPSSGRINVEKNYTFFSEYRSENSEYYQHVPISAKVVSKTHYEHICMEKSSDDEKAGKFLSWLQKKDRNKLKAQFAKARKEKATDEKKSALSKGTPEKSSESSESEELNAPQMRKNRSDSVDEKEIKKEKKARKKAKKKARKKLKKKLKKKRKKRRKKRRKELGKIVMRSKNLRHEIVSETLAELLASHGHLKKSIEMYQRMSLLNPQKSAYFAARIKKLTKKD